MHERAGRRAALLAREGEGRLQQRGDDVVEVGVGVDDDRVLAAHLSDHALEGARAGDDLRGLLEDLQAAGAGAGEDARVDARVGDQRRARLVAAGQE